MDKALFIGIGLILLIFGAILLVKPGTIPATQVRGFVFPAGVALLVLGLLAVGFPFSPIFKSATPESANNLGIATPSQAPTVPATQAPKATEAPVPTKITSPTDGAGVKGNFMVSGTAPNLSGDNLWLFVWSENATVPGKVYYRTSDAPVDISSGFWSTDVGALGEAGKEIGKIFILRLVRANSQCSETIKNITPNSTGEFFIRELPDGCAEAAPPLRVMKEA